MGSQGAMQEQQRANDVATILAIGAANPANVILQDDYPDFYFRATKRNDMLHLKQKFKRLCKNSMIEKRHFLYNDDLLMENPNIGTYEAESLNTRQTILIKEVPKLGMEAALEAINQWGQPLSEITHLIFYTTSCFGNMPGPDYHLANLLGLKPTVDRHMIFNNGCQAGGTVLRVAKDIVENNAESRVLVVWVESMVASFHGPNENQMDVLVGQAIFGDGAAALIIGTHPKPFVEHPLYELVLASQTTIPNTQSSICGSVQEMGLVYHFGKEIPIVISENIDKCLINAFGLIGVDRDTIDWNSLFYAIHPGGKSILNRIEEKLGLETEKLRASRRVLSQYGNMWSLSVIFVLDEMRKWSKIEGKNTSGEGKEWGVLVGFGPGISMEVIVLRSICFE
ncbi:Chitin synthase, class 2 [Stylosanthes scabra]|uniref:Chitin synthase, class 2 n=1 Tax=Stylosanthes scabra TaxID=79078 RepID=A0ABU6W8J0_9FABA|nr:Chitin synthase, class 2 [Stylosanthes scabra]